MYLYYQFEPFYHVSVLYYVPVQCAVFTVKVHCLLCKVQCGQCSVCPGSSANCAAAVWNLPGQCVLCRCSMSCAACSIHCLGVVWTAQGAVCNIEGGVYTAQIKVCILQGTVCTAQSRALKCPSKLIQIYPKSAEKIQTNPITYRYRSRSARAGTITNFFTLLWSCLDRFGWVWMGIWGL